MHIGKTSWNVLANETFWVRVHLWGVHSNIVNLYLRLIVTNSVVNRTDLLQILYIFLSCSRYPLARNKRKSWGIMKFCEGLAHEMLLGFFPRLWTSLTACCKAMTCEYTVASWELFFHSVDAIHVHVGSATLRIKQALFVLVGSSRNVSSIVGAEHRFPKICSSYSTSVWFGRHV